ncbi:metalloenzyme [Leptospira kirschneri]|uniref:metalloenzyme n=1 Tax=Leptospira kirschneri TaxID=29507 RepID=UPI0002784F70|nr:metalloenzyme [Leptospira kirschneri]EJO69117.1 metalloenzyme domain protein [Leptospira kirschneri serovar Grippotyphosa str. RM52]WBF94775.1 metalloenzyme [Leptospira kirschneri]
MIFYMFIDGIGFSPDDPETNPFSRYAKSFFLPLAGKSIPQNAPLSLKNTVFLKTDASMGIKGLPQSATGQTSLWTGINACKVLQRHLSGFPTFTLKKIISKYSIVRVLEERGFKADLLNCYTPAFTEYVKKNPRHVSASTLIQMASDKPLKGMDDLRRGRGLYMDITHEYLKEFSRGYLDESDELFQIRDPYQTGKSIIRNCKEDDYTLCIYEFFLTDKIGHKMNWEAAEKYIGELESFLTGILGELNPEEDQLIVTSDHGNLENLSVDVHTLNQVPTVLYGKYTSKMEQKIRSIVDIPSAIYDVLGIDIELKDEEFIKSEVT